MNAFFHPYRIWVVGIALGLSIGQRDANAQSQAMLACPSRSDSPLRLSAENIELTNGFFRICLPAVSGKTCLLEYKNNLKDTPWTAAAFSPRQDAQTLIADPSSLITHRFYRVALDPLSSLEGVARALVDRAKTNDFGFLAQYLDSGFQDQADQLAAMINRSGMMDNYLERAQIASTNLLRLNYHDLEKGCHFQVDLDHIDGGWKLKRIWFCR